MIKKIIIILLLVGYSICYAQNKGIQFENGSFEEMQTKAKEQQKYLLVLITAGEQKPSAYIEKTVLNNPLIANRVNSKAISWRTEDIQMKMILTRYNIHTLPCYLFFSPNGTLLHGYGGQLQEVKFKAFFEAALIPEKQYFTQLENFRQGRKNFESIPYMIEVSQFLGDNEQFGLAKSYLTEYVYKLPLAQQLEKTRLTTIRGFVRDTKEQGFKIIYNNPSKVDSIMHNRGFSERFTDMVIAIEKMKPAIQKVKQEGLESPDWIKIQNDITKSYNTKAAERIVLDYKADWYSDKKDWEKAATAFVDKKLKYGFDTSGYALIGVNNYIFNEIFPNVENKKILDQSSRVMEMLLEINPDKPSWLDTYANILYKLGRVQEALAASQKANKLAPSDTGIFDVLEKIKKGIPTWKRSSTPLMTTPWTSQVNSKNPLPEYPRPQLTRANWTNLNGQWDYAITDSAARSATTWNGKILVPYPIESQLSGVKKPLQPLQKLWYKRNINLKKKDINKRYLLNFGAVDYSCKVLLNGKLITTHTGGYQSFTVDMTEGIKAGENTLVVAVTDPTDQGINPHGKQSLNPQGIVYTATSGIWQTVWMEEVPKLYMQNLKISPNVDKGELKVFVRINDSRTSASISAKVPGCEGCTITSSEQKRDGISLTIKIPQAKLWSPENPYLYDLQLSLKSNEQTADEVQTYFGMRKVEIKKDEKGQERIFLNGKYTFNLGVLDQGFWPDGIYTAPTDSALRWDIQTIKDMGFNTIRKHIKIEPARWYYHADKVGMLIWQDMIHAGNLTEAGKGEYERENKINVEQLYNSPSIICWVLFNEGWNRYDQERITTEMKKIDPSRILDGHSGENYDRGSPADPTKKWINSDLTDIHDYPGPGLSPALPGKARVLGEWGGVKVATPGHQWDPTQTWGYIESDPKAFAEKLRFMTRHLKLYEEEGLSGSIYTQPFDVELEENGLVTYDRRIFKITVSELKKINQILLK